MTVQIDSWQFCPPFAAKRWPHRKRIIKIHRSKCIVTNIFLDLVKIIEGSITENPVLMEYGQEMENLLYGRLRWTN